MTPEFSVVIPTYRRPAELASCLGALAAQRLPQDRYEVVVIDDGGGICLEEVLAGFLGRLRLQFAVQSNGGPARARNTGAAVARGQYLAFTDDDCQPAPDWLAALGRRLESTPGRLIGGRTINEFPGNPYSSASQLILDIVYAHYNSDGARFFASNNMSVSAELFRQAGGFDERFRPASEDREFCDRWLHLGGQMTYAPEAVVCHARALTLRQFCRQHFAYGQGAVRYHQVRAGRGSGRLRSDIRFHLNFHKWFFAPLRREPVLRALKLMLLLIVWQVANAAGFLCAKLRLRPSRL